jgi:activator of HSP90 ATPase
MAKVGEGDPRWIVKNRDDGANVGGWHWSEFDVTEHAVSSLKAALTKVPLLAGPPAVRTGKVTKASGDATINNRKGKTSFLFDMSVTIPVVVPDSEVEASIALADLEQDTPLDEMDVRISVSGSTRSEQVALKEKLEKEGMQAIRKVLEGYVAQLKEHAHAVNKAKGVTPGTGKDGERTKISLHEELGSDSKAKKSESSKPKAAPTSLTLTRRFRCRPDDLYGCFVDMRRAIAWSQTTSTRVAPESGAEFALYDGAITGRNLVCQAPTRLEQEWRLGGWPAGVVSKVVLTFEWDGDASETKLKLSQTNVPEDQVDVTRSGWEQRIFDRIKGVFGF